MAYTYTTIKCPYKNKEVSIQRILPTSPLLPPFAPVCCEQDCDNIDCEYHKDKIHN